MNIFSYKGMLYFMLNSKKVLERCIQNTEFMEYKF